MNRDAFLLLVLPRNGSAGDGRGQPGRPGTDFKSVPLNINRALARTGR